MVNRNIFIDPDGGGPKLGPKNWSEFGVAIAGIVAVYFALYGVRTLVMFLDSEFTAKSWVAYILVIPVALLVGTATRILRASRSGSRLFAVLEIAAGTATFITGVIPPTDETGLVRLLAVFAGISLAADGFERYSVARIASAQRGAS